MAAEAGINIKVNDDGTINLQKFEKQVGKTMSTTKKSFGGMVSSFNSVMRSTTETIRNITQFALSIRFAYKTVNLLISSGILKKVSGLFLKVGLSISKKIGLTGALTSAVSKLKGAYIALLGPLAKIGARLGKTAPIVKAAIHSGFLFGAGILLKFKVRLLALFSPLGRIIKYFLTSTVVGKALSAVIRKLALIIKSLWASFKGNATVRKVLTGMRSRFSGLFSSFDKFKSKSTTAFASSGNAAKGMGKAVRNPVGSIKTLGSAIETYASKHKALNFALNIGKKALKLWITLGPLAKIAIGAVAAAFIGVTIAVVKFGKAALEVGRQNEMYTTQYKSLYNTLDKAQEKFKMVRKITASTPFQLDQMIQLNAQLKSGTGGMLDNAKGLQMIADAAAGTTKPLEEVGRVVGRLFAGFKNNIAVGEETRRAVELGLITGEDFAKLSALNASKTATSAQKIELLSKALAKYKGAAAAMALTLTGVTSNIRDMNRELASQTGDEMVAPVMLLKKTWLDFITAVQKTGVFKVVGMVFAAVINVISAALALILDPIKVLLNAGVSLVKRIKSLIAPVNGLTGGAGKLVKIWWAFTKSVLTLKPLLFIVKVVFWAIAQAMEYSQKVTFGLYKKFLQFTTSFKPIRSFFTWLDGALGKVAKLFGKVARAIDKFSVKIGAGALFGTTDQGKAVLDSIDFTGIQKRTDDLIKSLKGMTEKEKIIAKYQAQRKAASQDINKAKAKLKDSDFLASSKLELELKRRLSAISIAQQKELANLEKEKQEKEKVLLKERTQKLQEASRGVKALFDELNPLSEEQQIRKAQAEWTAQLKSLNETNKKAVDSFFGGLSKGIKSISQHTQVALAALKAQSKKEMMAAQEEMTRAELSRVQQEEQRTKGYASVIKNALKDNLEKRLSAGLISKGAYDKAMGDAGYEKAKETLVKGATALNVLKSQIGEAGIQGMFGASTDELLQKITDNADLEKKILEKRKKAAQMEGAMYDAVDALNTVRKSINAFQDLASGNLEQGLGGLGEVVGNTMTRFLGATGPWGEFLGTGLSFIGSLLDGGNKDRQEQMKTFQEIQRNTAKANQYLSSVDRNMSKLANRMEDLFILPDSAYFGSMYSLPELLDNEIAMGTQ